MNKDFLESSEFYSKRYNNFSTLIIIPTAIILIIVLLFSFLCKREITIKGLGNIEPQSEIPIIQSSSTNIINKNKLAEGKYVQKNEVLLTYNNNINRTKLWYYKKQRKEFNSERKGLLSLKKGLEQNEDVFKKDDNYGYHTLLKNYLAQRNIILSENNMEQNNSSFTNNKQKKLLLASQQTINRLTKDIQSYRDVYFAIQNGSNNITKNKYGYLYNSYLEETKNNENKNVVKEDYLNNIDQQMENLNENLETTKSQMLDIENFDNSTYTIQENNFKLSSLQSEELEKVAQNQVENTQKIKNVTINITNLKNTSKEFTIKAPKTGVLHINENYKDARYISPGVEIAEIYPVLKNQNYITIKSYVSTKDISSVKKNQKIRLKVTRNVPRPIIITGTIKNIGISPIKYKNNGAYLITSIAKVPKKQSKVLRYGMEGTTSIITGKTTFFNYYKNKLLDKE